MIGEIIYDGSQELPISPTKDIKVTVLVEDISRMDAPSEIIASTEIMNPMKFPIKFLINVNENEFALKHENTHTFSAKIEIGDKLIFLNEMLTSINNNGNYELPSYKMHRSFSYMIL